MNIIEKNRIRRKIHKLCLFMQKEMNGEDMVEIVCKIKNALRVLPYEKREGLLDVCLKVLKNEKCKI